jgi:mRNA (guanine-N7-)-methyltransferase
VDLDHGQVGWSSQMPPTTDKRNTAEEDFSSSKRRKDVFSSTNEGDYRNGPNEDFQKGEDGQNSTTSSEPVARRGRGRPKKVKGDTEESDLAQSRPASVTKTQHTSPKSGQKEGESQVADLRKDSTATSDAFSSQIVNSEVSQIPAPAEAKSSTASATPLSPLTGTVASTSMPPVVKTSYRPAMRVSVPTTIRLPVTSKQVDEMRFQCHNSLRLKWQEANASKMDGWSIIVADFEKQISQPVEMGSSIVARDGAGPSAADKKRKREKREEEENNAKLVALHYNSRQDQGLGARRQSPILPLRNFNNWIKSVLIGTYAKRQGRVLDLGGGKGGDLNKWDKGQIAEYILCDIASVSVEQAESRYNERRCRFRARFFSFDCFSIPLVENIPRPLLDPLFDNVTLQFCLHYGWESVSKAQLMLENIARYLKPGGIFVGTMPNADLLRSRLSGVIEGTPSASSETPDLSFGNQFYTVRFDPSTLKNGKFPAFGHKYYFTLVDAVDDVAEYVVDWDQFVSLANQNGLECIFKKPFEQIWREEGQMDRFRDLTRKMRISADGHPHGIPMNEELWEATGELADASTGDAREGRVAGP